MGQSKNPSENLQRSAEALAPALSVVIPTYREGAYLESCIRAVRGMHLSPGSLEIIVSDAESPDGTQEIAHRLADRLVVCPERGIAVGRNAGAAAARGSILLFVDADTALEAEFGSRCIRAFEDPSLVAFTGVPKPGGGSWFARFVYHGTYVLVRVFHSVGIELFPGICVAYRTEAFRAVGGFREDLGISEDIDLSRRIARLGRCLIDRHAHATVSTRRLESHALSVVLFHILNDIRYLVTGKSARSYPKSEETTTWSDIWKSFR